MDESVHQRARPRPEEILLQVKAASINLGGRPRVAAGQCVIRVQALGFHALAGGLGVTWPQRSHVRFFSDP